jgi:hypothetical protein
VSDIHTVAVDSLIALDPERPIREADVHSELRMSAFGSKADMRRTLDNVR